MVVDEEAFEGGLVDVGPAVEPVVDVGGGGGCVELVVDVGGGGGCVELVVDVGGGGGSAPAGAGADVTTTARIPETRTPRMASLV